MRAPRWFTLHQDQLRYYDNTNPGQSGTSLKGAVPVSRILAVEPADDMGDKQFIFQVVHTAILYCQVGRGLGGVWGALRGEWAAPN